MVDTHVSPKRTRNKLQGKLRQRTRNGNYSYRLTSSNGARKEFTLQTRNYDEAVRKASELDSIWLAPTKEVALAQMNAMRGVETAPKRYYRVIDWKQERPKLYDLLVELETAEKMNAMQQCVVIWRNDAPYVLVNGNFARNAANLANYMASGNVPAETVQKAQRGEDVNLTLDGKAVAELFSPAAAVVRLEDLEYDLEELDRVLDLMLPVTLAPPGNTGIRPMRLQVRMKKNTVSR